MLFKEDGEREGGKPGDIKPALRALAGGHDLALCLLFKSLSPFLLRSKEEEREVIILLKLLQQVLLCLTLLVGCAWASRGLA